jgi:hypothetical protein
MPVYIVSVLYWQTLYRKPEHGDFNRNKELTVFRSATNEGYRELSQLYTLHCQMLAQTQIICNIGLYYLPYTNTSNRYSRKTTFVAHVCT